MKIAVIGAGVIGISTGIAIQDSLRDADVTIIADKFNKHTLSDGAAGLFRPPYCFTDKDSSKNLYESTFGKFMECVQSPQAGRYGTQLVSGYMLSDQQDLVKNLWYKNIVWNYRELEEEEMKDLNTEQRYGCFFTTIVTDCRRYLPHLMIQFTERGGHVINSTIENLKDVKNLNVQSGDVKDFDVVVNCTGLLSTKLFPSDTSLVPVKGQVVRVDAPWIKHFWYISDSHENDFNTYIIPSTQAVVLGGTRDVNVSDPQTSPDTTRDIIKRCSKLVPSVKNSHIITEWAGLRPYRPNGPRLEIEVKDGFKIIHNYGHGGNGISLSWGCALKVVEMIESLIKK